MEGCWWSLVCWFDCCCCSCSVAELYHLFVTPWTAAHQSPLSSTISQSLIKFVSFESVMPSNHLILCCPLLFCHQSFPTSGSFPMSRLFAWGGPSTGASASASVPPVNIQGWFSLGMTDLISLLSKGLARVLCSTTIQKHWFFDTQPSLCPTLTSVHDCLKNH